jgi:cell wall-associated NlpC family hydrolase
MEMRLTPMGLLLLLIGLAACAGAPEKAPVSPPGPEPVHIRLPTIQFTIQVGAFSTAERAARYADLLCASGLDAYYFIDRDGLCKVRFERFETQAAARSRAVVLQAKGVIGDFYVVQPGPAAAPMDPRPELSASLVATAQRFIGIPYRWGGESKASGFDCSGLTMTVYRLNGLELPRNALAQSRAGTAVARGTLQPGDLVFFATGSHDQISHVGLYSGQGLFIHAPGRGQHIRSASLSNGYFKARYRGARRYF